MKRAGWYAIGILSIIVIVLLISNLGSKPKLSPAPISNLDSPESQISNSLTEGIGVTSVTVTRENEIIKENPNNGEIVVGSKLGQQPIYVAFQTKEMYERLIDGGVEINLKDARGAIARDINGEIVQIQSDSELTLGEIVNNFESTVCGEEVARAYIDKGNDEWIGVGLVLLGTDDLTGPNISPQSEPTCDWFEWPDGCGNNCYVHYPEYGGCVTGTCVVIPTVPWIPNICVCSPNVNDGEVLPIIDCPPS